MKIDEIMTLKEAENLLMIGKLLDFNIKHHYNLISSFEVSCFEINFYRNSYRFNIIFCYDDVREVNYIKINKYYLLSENVMNDVGYIKVDSDIDIINNIDRFLLMLEKG